MPADLLSLPRCTADHLGLPMPDDAHAVSCCLPLWEHNVAYEEGVPAVIDRLQTAYPRFCFHPLINRLCDTQLNSAGWKGLPFASRTAANRAQQYVQHAVGVAARVAPLTGQTSAGVTVPEQHFGILKQYWQHAGENVSSRSAEQILSGATVSYSETSSRSTVRQRVAEFQAASVEDTFLYPSGMAAIAAAWRAVQTVRLGATCQFGFPYVDTLKIQQRFPGPAPFFLPIGDDADLAVLEKTCAANPPVAVFCEVPTNPLLIAPNLRRLRQLADQHGFLLVVDDTLAACGNLRVTDYADLLVTSLTKYFSGGGNVLAGSLVVSPTGPKATELRTVVAGDFEEMLSDIDVDVLCQNSGDYQQRISVINANALRLADFLRTHDAVDRVYYPTHDDAQYESLRRDEGGYGGLLSIVLRDAADTTKAVFDALEVCKGPNLGTNFTLCCPYTILAHYDELAFAEDCGVSRWLLRISVGMEPLDVLIERFRRAFSACREG